jgi:hypothetical protein
VTALAGAGTGGTVAVVLAVGAVLLALDRLLLAAEARGWINYRRHGLSRSAVLYHTLELHSVFDPGIRQVIEIRNEERKNQAESGDPLFRVTMAEVGMAGEPPGGSHSRRGARTRGLLRRTPVRRRARPPRNARTPRAHGGRSRGRGGG